MTTTQAPELASFALLREVARAEGIKEQIEARRDQVALSGWDIVPSAEASRALHGNFAAMRETVRRCDMAGYLFRQPDLNYRTFGAWLAALAEDLLVIDAAAMRLRKAQSGRLIGLDLLDGATVEPWPDSYLVAQVGARQYLSEIPRRGFAEIAASPVVPGCTVAATYAPGEVQYLSMTVRRFTPFGYSPLERALARNEDGDIDPAATAERLRQAADDRWVTVCRDWLRRGLFAFVLEHFGDDLRWEWEESLTMPPAGARCLTLKPKSGAWPGNGSRWKPSLSLAAILTSSSASPRRYLMTARFPSPAICPMPTWRRWCSVMAAATEPDPSSGLPPRSLPVMPCGATVLPSCGGLRA